MNKDIPAIKLKEAIGQEGIKLLIEYIKKQTQNNKSSQK